MADFIKLPRSWLDSRITSEADYLKAVVYLATKIGENGSVDFSSGDAKMMFGMSPRRYRTFMSLITNDKQIDKQATNRTTNIRFECQIVATPKRQARRQTGDKPTDKQKPTVTTKTSSDTFVLESYVDPRFAEAWLKWLDYRKEINNRYKSPKSERIGYDQFIKKSNNDPIQAMEMVDNTIANGYKGLFPDRSNGTAKPTNTAGDYASRAESRRRMSALASEIVSRDADIILGLYDGQERQSDHRIDKE